MEAESTKTIYALMHEADIALYRSKATGKNRVTYFSESLSMPGVRQETNPGTP